MRDNAGAEKKQYVLSNGRHVGGAKQTQKQRACALHMGGEKGPTTAVWVMEAKEHRTEAVHTGHTTATLGGKQLVSLYEEGEFSKKLSSKR